MSAIANFCVTTRAQATAKICHIVRHTHIYIYTYAHVGTKHGPGPCLVPALPRQHALTIQGSVTEVVGQLLPGRGTTSDYTCDYSYYKLESQKDR